MRIASIQIGERVRKDMGDLSALAESIKRHGLLHPVVVKPDGSLVAGHRRIEAAKLIGWDEVPVTVVDVDDLLSAERDENTERKDFTTTEAVAIGRIIEERAKAHALEAKRRGGERAAAIRRGDDPEKIPESIAHGDTREIVGRAIGMSGPQYQRANAVVTAAESDPQTFGDLPEQMDTTGNVNGAHEEMKRRKNGNGRHPALRKMHYPKPNREMERAIPALDGICDCLEAINPEELDANKRSSWAAELKKIASRIGKSARRIDGKD